MKWIGLTGGIATGKSTVKKLVESRGLPVIDADDISHQLTQIGSVGLQKIVSHFGSSVLNPDQSLNRKVLAEIIFKQTDQRLELENILHPMIQKEVQFQKNKYQAEGRNICFYDVPLLFEKKLESNFDQIILVWCDLSLQKHRLKLRNHLSNEEIEIRLASQAPMSLKISKSHFCLDNSSDLKSLDIQIEQLLRTIV